MSRPQFWALPAWEQADHIADWEIEREKCPQCGGPREVCGDPDLDWYHRLTVCEPTMLANGAARRWALKHKDKPFHDGDFQSWAKEPSNSHPYHFEDGVRVWVSRDDPGPDFLLEDDPRVYLVGVAGADQFPGQDPEADQPDQTGREQQ